ncbi:CHAP domain-containing protein [Nocardioides sp.]|uniref:CHAP domain-containing protein n=1 Tax=Nocardioides sp. TaxID=35761 RepID=UPI0039E657C8
MSLLAALLGPLSASWSVTVDQGTASSQVLCRGFAACRSAGMPHRGYKGAMGQMYWNMYSGVNCTNYVAYRMIKNGGSATRPAELKASKGNATYWGTSFGSITNGTPAIGAIAWWKAGTNGGGSAGHVAYVEQILSANEIVISESNYGSEFSWRRIRSDGPWPSGFIHYRDLAVTNTGAPSIGGTVQVGQTLSVNTGSWKPAPDSYAYQWYASGAPIPGATGSTFVPGPSLVGQQLAAVVVAGKQWYASAAAGTAWTAPVVPGDLRADRQPTVTGTAQVDKTLTVDTGAYSPAPDNISVQWLADGVPIQGANGASFVPTKAQAGQGISAAVTATKAGYNTLVATSAPTDPVLAPNVGIVTPGRIDGEQLVGSVLTVDPGVLDPADSTATYVWQRDGKSMPAFTGASYVVKPRDIGKSVSVKVTLSHEGYLSRTVVLGPVGKIAAPATVDVKVANARPRSLLVKVIVSTPDTVRPSGKVWIKVAGKKVAVTLVRGVAKVRLDGLKSGERPLDVYYAGSDRLTTARASATVTIEEGRAKPKKKAKSTRH